MKKLLIKIPAMIAMLIAVFSYVFYIYSFIDVESEIWILSVIVALLSMVFYFIDAIICFVKAIMKKDTKFNLLLGIVLIVAIPLVIDWAGSGRDILNVLWNIYFLFMFVLEIISMRRLVK